MGPITHKSTWSRLALSFVGLVMVAGCGAPAQDVADSSPAAGEATSGIAAAAPAQVKVAMKVLVLDDGESMAAAITNRLELEGIPASVLKLKEPGRQQVTPDFLATTAADGVHANYAGIVLPGADSSKLSAAERTVLQQYGKTFKVRSVETNPSDNKVIPAPRYEGPLDGASAQVTEAGRQGDFSYLKESISLDNDSDAEAVWGVLTAKSLRPAAGAEFVPLVTTRLPKTDIQAPLIAEQRLDGQESLLLGLNGDSAQAPVQVLNHGVVKWLTRGVSTSVNRNYVSVHIDDVLLPNAQWSTDGQCEVGRNCPTEHSDLGPIRMVADDVPALVDWQKKSGIYLDVVMNGAGAGQYAVDHGGQDPLMESVKAHKDDLRLISHTWTHRFLGCDRELQPDDWKCQTDAAGNTRWLDQKTVSEELVKNTEFMAKNDLSNYDPKELVTGEHSGLVHAPQQMADNPNLAPAIDAAGITWVASDDSEEGEHWPRALGGATTVPRHPIDLDYNTPTGVQVVSQRNHLFTSKADGGSGICETDEKYAPCKAPLDLASGFANVIAPNEGKKIFEHSASNDPRPHYAHQANLAGERLMYPVMDIALAEYRATYADNTPLLNPTMTKAGEVLVNQRRWIERHGQVEATVAGQIVTLRNNDPRDVQVPVTAPEGVRKVISGQVGPEFGEAYSGSRSAWAAVPAHGEIVLQLDQQSGFATQASWPATAKGK